MIDDPNSQMRKRGAVPPRDNGPVATGGETIFKDSLQARIGAVLLILAAVAFGTYRLVGQFGHAAPSAAKTAEPLIRTGDRVSVPEGSPARSGIAVAAVAERDLQHDLVLPAVVEADPAQLIKVSPPLAGRVTQLKVQLGERVTAGQPLVVMDSPDLAAAYSDYDRAKVLLSLALKNRDRQRGLEKIGGAAQKDLQQAETDYVTAEVEYQRATAHLRQIGVDPDTAAQTRTVTVAAPMAGSIIELAVAPGEYWNDATASLMTVADLSTIWVTASVPEKDTALVAKGQAADVVFAAYPDETFSGQVLFVSDVLDPDTRRTKVRIAFENKDLRLRPGMFATVKFHAPAQKSAVIPTSALVLKDDLSEVFVETAPWSFEARQVDVGFQQGGEAVVTSGLKPGERIVVKGGVLLSD